MDNHLQVKIAMVDIW